jgi:Lrp/AsnC family transcriptional regulator for asnA, asnC and gidA
MRNANRDEKHREDNLLRIRSSAELPSHKVEVPLDDLDRDILEMHQKDVFFSYAELAEKWDVTDATIRNRIKRLKASGVMDVIMVMNPYKIGFNTFAIIGVKLETGADLDEIVSELLSIPGVNNLVMVAGRYDFFVNYVCQNMEEYRRFIANKLRKIPGISNVESFLGLDLYERKFELGIIR